MINEPWGAGDVLGGNSDRRSRSTVAQGTKSTKSDKDRGGLASKVFVGLMVTRMINRTEVYLPEVEAFIFCLPGLGGLAIT